MLDSETKRHIDTCRDILVGKVPDPKSQVEQITIALIYKFMDDMDAEAEELGGTRSFFTGDFAKYGWSKLMAPNMGGFDMLSLYSEAIQKMNENPGVPVLFRDIFKNAYLPYRDPETLRSFLKEINTFTYDHSERLGDAFEYLLSVLGSQGEAGQFRTPRHIIDFMVELIDPTKDETILDPACGTAGFLISSYKHILKHNTGELQQQDREAHDEKGVELERLTLDNPLHYKGDLLTPDDKKRIAANIWGYDISPDMVRLSLVNMYLHGFTDPHIDEYDTLTSDEKWNELADVILANPPFMSPKGGIKPHKRFSVQAKRSEVLFVDYIAEHLTPNGRAAVVVPEGIIFQCGTAYKQLREMLVKDYLVAVISLPAGVFNPYSGVKTSILLMDKRLAKKSSEILFAKIDNDGFNLGAQRRPIDKNDLPAASRNIRAWLESARNDGEFDVERFANLNLVAKEEIGENGEWSLSGDRYLVRDKISSRYDLVSISSVCDLVGGGTPSKAEQDYWTGGTIKWISSKHIDDRGNITGNELVTQKAVAETSTKVAPQGSVILITRVSVGKFAFADDDYAINQDLTAVIPKDDKVLNAKYFFCIAREVAKIIEKSAQGIGVRGVTRSFLADLKIPLPPLEVQQEIVAEIEGYQKVIDGARQVVENYQPRIPIHPDWPMEDLGGVCSIGGSITKSVEKELPYIGADSLESNTGQLFQIKTAKEQSVSGPVYEFAGRRLLYSKIRPYLNKLTIVDFKGYCSSDMYPLAIDETKAMDLYVAYYMLSSRFNESIRGYYERASIPKINRKQLFSAKVPLPDLDTQHAIVAQIENEQNLVNANKELARLFENKIQATINRLWGEAE